MAIPKKDSLLLNWSTNFDTRITATPTVFGLTAGQATSYATLHDAFVTAYNACNTIGARSKALITAKDTAKTSLLAFARELYGYVQANTTVSDANKDLLGVNVKATPSPIPAPTVSPALDIVSVVGRTVKIRLHDASGEGKRSKPAGVMGAAVCSFVGPTAPTDPSLYKWEGNTNRAIIDVVFPDTVAPGAVVWLTAMWLNQRQQTGPAATPISAYIQQGIGSMAA